MLQASSCEHGTVQKCENLPKQRTLCARDAHPDILVVDNLFAATVQMHEYVYHVCCLCRYAYRISSLPIVQASPGTQECQGGPASLAATPSIIRDLLTESAQ